MADVTSVNGALERLEAEQRERYKPLSLFNL